MNLIDGHRYALPLGVIVEAIDYAPGRWRLDTLDGQPAYLMDAPGVWHKLVYEDAADAYHFTPCDLTTDDLTPTGEMRDGY